MTNSKVLFFLSTIITTALILGTYYTSSRYYGPFVISNFLICILSLFFLFRMDDQPYSLYKIFYLFIFFFFGIAPMIQFSMQSSFFGALPLSDGMYFQLNIIILFICLLFHINYKISYKYSLAKRKKNFYKRYDLNNRPISFKGKLVLLFLSIVSFLIIFYINGFSFASLLVRGGEDKQAYVGNDSVGLIIYRFIQPMSMMAFLYYLLSLKKNFFLLFFLLVITLFTASPTSMARFSFAALYLPVLILSFSWLRRKNIFSLLFVFGLLIVFPFMDQFRYFDQNSAVSFELNFDSFKQAHFDSYNNFGLILSHDIVTSGRQLLGVVFFWVPRTIWPTKPIGSGAFLADKIHLYFSNISANYFAEGYINFGYIGILLFLIMLSFITAKIDKIYWSNQRGPNLNRSYFHVIYLVLLSMLFFILRGDLLSSFAYTCGFLLSCFTVFGIVNSVERFSKKGPRQRQ